jgi:putative aldouronate transport system permease protein
MAHLPFYLMILPGLLYFLIFKYVPMFGLLISFQRYDPFVGILNSTWVGLANFRRLFTEQDFPLLLKNTFMFAGLDILFFFPAPILLAILLNETRIKSFRNAVQTVMYAPHFISWVVIVSLTMTLFSSQDGIVNEWLSSVGLGTIDMFTKPEWLKPMWLLQNIWQGMGWGSILYLATIASIDPSLYEAARMDGAGRFRQIWHVTLPGIRYVIVVLFILRLGEFMDIGFEHIFLLQNPLNVQVSDVFDTYVYRTGILQRDYSYSAVVGMFKSLVGLTLVLGANRLARKLGEEGVY